MIVKERKRIRSRSYECEEVTVDNEHLECSDGQEFSSRTKILPEGDTLEVEGDGFNVECEVVAPRGDTLKCRQGQLAYRWERIPLDRVESVNDS